MEVDEAGSTEACTWHIKRSSGKWLGQIAWQLLGSDILLPYKTELCDPPPRGFLEAVLQDLTCVILHS